MLVAPESDEADLFWCVEARVRMWSGTQ